MIWLSQTFSVIEVVAPLAVGVLPVEEKKEVEKVDGRLLNDSANSIFMDLLDDSDDDEEEDEEEERIFSRDFNAEKMFGTLQVLGSIIASSQRAERESRPTRKFTAVFSFSFSSISSLYSLLTLILTGVHFSSVL